VENKFTGNSLGSNAERVSIMKSAHYLHRAVEVDHTEPVEVDSLCFAFTDLTLKN